MNYESKQSLLTEQQQTTLPVQAKTRYSRKIVVLVTLLFLLVGATIQNTVLQFWVQSFPPGIGGPYFILCWASLLFVFFFGGMYLGKQLINKHNVPPTSLFWKNYLLQGLTNALNGICLVYSSPPSHTPPILFVILINMGIFFGMILTKYMIPSKRHINYRNKSVYISLICLALSVGITIAGDIVGKGDEATSFNGWSVMWILITTIASFFSALYNVLQERYMLESHLMIKPEEENTNLLKTLYWTSLFQLMFMILFFWVDMIPHFGYTSNFPDFFNNLKLEIECFFFSHECGAKNFGFGILFSLGYITAYMAGMFLNKQSANFSIYAIALQTPFSILVFVITGLGSEHMPLWSVIPAVIFIGLGIYIWKRWEIKNIQMTGHI